MRKYKKLDIQEFKKSLASHPWENLAKMDIHEQVETFEQYFLQTLNIYAPLKKVKIHNNFIPGLSDETKDMMKQRNKAQRKLKESTGSKKEQLLDEYRKLRNKCTSAQRKDLEKHYLEKYSGLTETADIWKASNAILCPKSQQNIILSKEGEEISDEEEVAGQLGSFFIEKIEKLKANINKDMMQNPCQYLETDLTDDLSSVPKLFFHKVDEKRVEKEVVKLKNKTSHGLDEIDSLLLKETIDVLIAPLTLIVNTSIENNCFPNK